MRVFTVNNPEDETVLRKVSTYFTEEDLKSDNYKILKRRMLETVLDTTNAGVGIAAPQVGISRRLVAVQRFDKPGEPFEFYPNLNIREMSPQKRYGWEGCLSIPGKRDTVLRSEWVIVTYTDDVAFTEKTDTVSGFTAIIFQHEADHLEGILYTDRRADGNRKD
jgi:peptide deformylase